MHHILRTVFALRCAAFHHDDHIVLLRVFISKYHDDHIVLLRVFISKFCINSFTPCTTHFGNFEPYLVAKI